MVKLDRSFFFIMVNGWPHVDDPKSLETLASLRPGQWYRADIRSDRKHGTLRKWWAGLSWMIQRWEGEGDHRANLFPTSRKLNDAVLVMLGYREVWYHLDGSMQFRADSIRFEAMTEAEFEGMFEKARVLAYDQWGIDPWDEWLKEQQAKKELEGK